MGENLSTCHKMSQEKITRRSRRIQVDVFDVQDKIDSLRPDVTWRELPLSMKCRILILERLEQIAAEQGK